MSIKIVPSPFKTLKPWSQKIHWGWYDISKNLFIVSNQRSLWSINPFTGKTECILDRSQNERISPQGVGGFNSCSVSDVSLEALIDEGIRGFQFLQPHEYNLEDANPGVMLMYLSHALTWGLNGKIAVRHRGDNENTLSFEDRSVSYAGKLQKLSEHTHRHIAHPSETAFFTGNSQGEIYKHAFDDGELKKPVKIHDASTTINDIAISASGMDLLIAAQGSLIWLRRQGSAYKKASEIKCSPRQIILGTEGKVIVNQGRNGMTTFRMEEQLVETSSEQIGHSSHQIILSQDERFYLYLPQGNGENMIIIDRNEKGGSKSLFQ